MPAHSITCFGDIAEAGAVVDAALQHEELFARGSMPTLRKQFMSFGS